MAHVVTTLYCLPSFSTVLVIGVVGTVQLAPMSLSVVLPPNASAEPGKATTSAVAAAHAASASFDPFFFTTYSPFVLISRMYGMLLNPTRFGLILYENIVLRKQCQTPFSQFKRNIYIR